MKLLKTINWPMITIECMGFWLGIFIGVNLGFIMGFVYVIFPWGVP